MTDIEQYLRPATPKDGAVMAQLINMAGEGMPLYLWAKMAGSDQSAWEVGVQRASRSEGGFSYLNTILYESNERVLAGLVGYALANEPSSVDYDGMPAMFVPLQQLEDLAPGT